MLAGYTLVNVFHAVLAGMAWLVCTINYCKALSWWRLKHLRLFGLVVVIVLAGAYNFQPFVKSWLVAKGPISNHSVMLLHKHYFL